MEFSSPAKLNLMLHITGRRADGYHLLQTVFQFIDLCDQIRFEINRTGSIRRVGDNQGIDEQQDLLVRAAGLLKRSTGCELGVDISVNKLIPLGGGLGGGSSNAATCLLALNQLWNLGLSQQELAALGLELGADVPVFVRGHSAWAEGVGEQIQPLDIPESWYLVLHPGINVPTGQIFSDQQLTRNCDPITIRGFLRAGGENVCEPVARRLFPVIDQSLSWLGQRANAKMTGTGACIYAAFDSKQNAEKVKSEAPVEWTTWVTRGLNRSPVLDELEKLI